MNKFNIAPIGATLIVGLVAASAVAQKHPGKLPPLKPVPYRLIASMMKFECESCHNAKKHPENVDLSSYSALMASGEKGPIVIPGHPEKSKLLLYVDGTKNPRMPFKSKPLGSAEIDLLRRWIITGAKGK